MKTEQDTGGSTDLVEHSDTFTAEDQAAFDAMQGDGSPDGVSKDDVTPEGAPSEAESVQENAPNEDGKQARDDKGRFVPHGAFHEEREKRKAAEGEVQKLRDLLSRGDERLRILAAAAAPKAAAAPEKPKAPDPAEDIFGAFEALKAELAELRGGHQKTTEQLQAERYQRSVVDTYAADARAFAERNVDFGEAYQFLVRNRAEELHLSGFSPEQIDAAIQQDEFTLAQACLQSRQSPAARIYQLAKLRGFRTQSGSDTDQPEVETSAEKVARVAAGQAAGKSLSSAGGSPAGEMTVKQLAEMSEADFAEYVKKNPRRTARLMGKSD